jgi:uncharacterized protein YgiM (DUF1202 family)
MIPILAGIKNRYWQMLKIDTGREDRSRFDTGRSQKSILAGIRYWLPILAGIALGLSSLACASPSWAPVADPTGRAETVSTPTRAAPQTSQKPAIADPQAPEPLRETVSALEALNVRKDATERSASLGTLRHGAPVELTGLCSQGWARIRYKSGLAWVKARFITGDLCEGE